MKARHMAGMLFAVGLLIIGCGGGGSGTSGTTGGTGTTTGTTGTNVSQTVEVLPNQPTNVSLKNFSVEINLNAANTVTLTEQGQATQRPPQPGIASGGWNLAITTTNPASGFFTLRYPPTENTPVVAMLAANGWYQFGSKLENGNFVVTLPTVMPNFGQANRSGVVDFNSTVFIGNLLPEASKKTRLVHMAGQNAYDRYAIITQGWHDNLKDFQLLANTLVISGLVKSVFGIEYDWKQPIDKIGKEFAQILRVIKERPQPKRGIMIGHSMGGLVCRYCLEIEGESLPIQTLVTVASPFEGPTLGASFVPYLNWQWINSVSALGFAQPSTPSVAQMLPDSDFLALLNQEHQGQIGQVDYINIGALGDIVVDEVSARGDRLQLEAVTGGSIWRASEPGTHGYLVKDTTGINRLIEMLWQYRNRDTNFSFELTPTSSEPVTNNYWQFEMRFRNTSNRSAVLKDLQLCIFNGGSPFDLQQWWDPLAQGEFFPEDYHAWDLSLAPGESFPSPYSDPIQVRAYVDYDKSPIALVSPEQQTQTLVLVARVKPEDGLEFTVTQHFVCKYNGLSPSTPQTLSGRPTGRGMVFGPAK